MTAVAVRGLSAGYNGVPILKDVSLTVAQGEIVALLGSNGAGKTTTLLAVSGMLPALAGEVEVLGRTKRQATHLWARHGLGMVPEDRGLFRDLTVAENLRVARRKGSRDLLDEVLDYFPALASLLHRRCGLLSGGEQQMVGIARALVGAPKVLLIDELSLGLAPVVVQRILPAIRRIATERATAVLLVDQHVHLALGVADRAYVLRHGSVALEGVAAELAARPEVLAASYLGEAPL